MRLAAFTLPMTLGLSAAPSVAQTTVDPAAWSLPNVMVEGMRTSSHAARPTRRASEAGARRTCRELPLYRSKLGAADSRIMRLTKMCRQLGH